MKQTKFKIICLKCGYEECEIERLHVMSQSDKVFISCPNCGEEFQIV